MSPGELHSTLVVDDLTSGYGSYPVLHGLSLEVRRSEVCSILGPNGAGKSTLLKTIMGLVPKCSGSIEFEETQLLGRRLPDIANAGVAYVPEGRGVLNSLTVRENLLMSIRRRGQLYRDRNERRRALDEAYDRFPVLGDRSEQPAGELSGGEQQMLVLARALAWKPLLLVVDEPSLGLAPQIRELVAMEFPRIASEEGIAILLAEQDIRFAARCSNRAYFIRSGTLIAETDSREMPDPEALFATYMGQLAELDPQTMSPAPLGKE